MRIGGRAGARPLPYADERTRTAGDEPLPYAVRGRARGHPDSGRGLGGEVSRSQSAGAASYAEGVDSGPGRQRRQTEWQLVAGGFAIVAVVGDGLLWLLYGRTTALLALSVLGGALVIFGLLWLFLRALEAWAKGES